MTDKKPETPELTTDILIADCMLRLTALETLLLQKGVFTRDELTVVSLEITERLSKAILEKVQVSKNLDEFISSLKGEKKAVKN